MIPQADHVLVPSGAFTTANDGNHDAVKVLGLLGPVRGVMFVLEVTAAATDVGDTLDVSIETKLGGDWTKIVSFTQVLGNGGAKRHVAKVCADEAQAMFEAAAALAAGSVRHLLGREFRAVSAIVDADADASFTFSVTAIPF